MLFVQSVYFGFFLLVFALHWSLPGNRSRKALLLVASYVFYAAWDWRFLFLIWASTLVDYVVGLGLLRTRRDTPRRLWLLVSLLVNLGLLGFFKYFNFFIDSAVELLNLLGFSTAGTGTLDIILPVGISFYTFQTLSYSIDVYWRKLEPTTNLLDLALFVGFFPQLVAGPIVRARDFLPQLASKRTFRSVDVRTALVLFLIGFIKKACISDNLAPAADAYFADPELFDAAAAYIATLLYTVQAYCDFSGYSDMAIASAALLGYRLCDNFDFPLLAVSVRDFWRRWHISLSYWLRDYLYLPLGGSRRGPARNVFNVMVTMILCGLWHGAAWTFVLFGAMHGMALVLNRMWFRLAGERLSRFSFWTPVSIVLAFAFFAFSLAVFRSQSLSNVWTSLASLTFLDSPGARSLSPAWLALVAGLAVVHIASYRRVFSGWWRRGNDWVFATAFGLAVAVVCGFVPMSIRPFIYFQF